MRNKRKLAVIAGVVALMAIATAAFAYWTTNGTGSDNALAGSAGNYTVAVTLDPGIHPGGDVGVAGTITNNTTSDLQVSTISIDPAYAASNGVTFDAGHSSCNALWFHFSGTVTGGTQQLAAGGGSTPYTGTLTMDESNTNQDACQGADVTLHLQAA